MRLRTWALSTALALTPLAGAEGQSVADTIAYAETVQGPLLMLVTRPADWSPDDRRPAVVFFYGGAWTNRSMDQFARHADYFASRGLVALRADHRVGSVHGTEPDAAARDGRTAVRWIRAHAGDLGIDPERIVASGASSGGHVAACTAHCPLDPANGEEPTVSSRPDALILFNPVVDYEEFAGWPEVREAFLWRFTGLAADADLRAMISPVAHVDASPPPTLQFFGSEDDLIRQGRRYAVAIEARGGRSEIFVAEGADHGFFNRSPWFERTLRRADEFLGSLGYLQGPPSLEAR